MTKQCPISRNFGNLSESQFGNLQNYYYHWASSGYEYNLTLKLMSGNSESLFLLTEAVHLLILYYSIIYLSPVVRLLVIASQSRIGY